MRTFSYSIYRDDRKYFSLYRHSTPIKHAIFVEVHESVEETEWLLKIADQHKFIKGGYSTIHSIASPLMRIS